MLTFSMKLVFGLGLGSGFGVSMGLASRLD